MTNLLSFVVILRGGKSKPLHHFIAVLSIRKTYGKPSYITHLQAVNSERTGENAFLPKKAYLAFLFYYQYN